MILRITGFTQEELANFVGVSRASINSWITNDDTMSNNSKKIIADKFQFPPTYFDVDLNQNLDYYKLIFSTLNDNWKRIRKTGDCVYNNSDSKKIDDIINYVESDFSPIENLKDNEILEALVYGYNPFTGEMFNRDHILNNNIVKKVLNNIYKNYKLENKLISKEDLTEDQKLLFEELREWRKDKYREEGFFNAYMVFNDRELVNIITADIAIKEDLLNVKGIGMKKYNKYADELYSILLNRKYERKNGNINIYSNINNTEYANLW